MTIPEQTQRSAELGVRWLPRSPGWCPADEAELLRDLQHQWSIELGAALFAAIRDGEGDLAKDFAVAYAETVARLHDVHAVLEANATHPAIAVERAKERRLLELARAKEPGRYPSVA